MAKAQPAPSKREAALETEISTLKRRLAEAQMEHRHAFRIRTGLQAQVDHLTTVIVQLGELQSRRDHADRAGEKQNDRYELRRRAREEGFVLLTDPDAPF